MKAIAYTKYGTPETLQLKEIKTPTPKENEVLIKTHAASINSWDWDKLIGKSIFVKLEGPLIPKHKILGADMAGKVEAVGSKVKKFQPGDEVYGDLCENGWSTFAEYVCAPEDSLTIKPAWLTFEQAATIPQAGVLAIQGLEQKTITPGLKVLINGAGGGVGTFAVQVAKLHGAEVTAVDSKHKLDKMLELGADHVIDYIKEDYTQTGNKYDLIVDVIAKRSPSDYKMALNPGGIFGAIGGSPSTIVKILAHDTWAKMAGKKICEEEKKHIRLVIHKPNQGLHTLAGLIKTGKIKPIIDKCFPLDETGEAFHYFGKGLFIGKIVITML